MLYAIYDKKFLHNLSSGEKSAKMNKITAYCVSAHGAALLLLSDEKTAEQSVVLLRTLSAKKEEPQKITLKTQNGEGDKHAFHATGVALLPCSGPTALLLLAVPTALLTPFLLMRMHRALSLPLYMLLLAWSLAAPYVWPLTAN